MRNLFQLIIIILFVNTSFAQQPCNDDVLLKTKGAWKKTSDYNMNAGNQSQVISRIDKMQKVLQTAYSDPRGIEAGWHRGMVNNPLVSNGPTPYQLNAMFLIYYCMSEKEMVLGDETSTWFYVYANHFNWFMEYNHDFTVHKNPVYLLTKKVGEIRGYPVYEGINNGTSNTGTTFSRAVIITRQGQSPYVPVTQKQYLKGFLLVNEKWFVENLAYETNRTVKTDAQEEEEKQNGLKGIEKGYKADAVERYKAYYLKNYKTGKQEKEAHIARIKKDYEDKMKPARDLLADSLKADLGQPAIVDDIDFLKFIGFSTEAKDGRRLVSLNPGYFDSKLPKYVPQFLIVYWRWEKNKASENVKDQLEANFSFNALKEMIDK